MTILGEMIIGQQCLRGTGGEARGFNPATRADLEPAFGLATGGDVERACALAAQAFDPYRTLPLEQRARFLEAVAEQILAVGPALIERAMLETGLPQARLEGERMRTVNQLRLFAKVVRDGYFMDATIDSALPDRAPPRPDLRLSKVGLGPVAVFGASNFPLAFSTAGGDTAAALAAGCPVVFKAHSGHMATADLVASAIIRAAERTGMPKGVFNMIFGNGVGEGLVKHPAIQAVGFTGSLNGGNALCKMAAERPQPIPVFAEMSSINPVVLLPEALATRSDSVAKDLAASVVMGAGQFCTNPGVVIGLRSPAFSSFLEQLTEQMGGQAPQTMLNAGGLRSYSKGVEHLLSHPGVTHLAGKPQEGKQAQAQLFKADVSLLLNGDPLLQEEVFGPTTLVIEVADDAELKNALLALRGQLTATLIGEPTDLSKYSWLLPLLEDKVGRILVNGYPTGVEVCEAMVHGGPYPATSDARGTSVGTLAIDRFLRPVCYQNHADSLLPPALQNANPLGLRRLVNGEWSDQPIV